MIYSHLLLVLLFLLLLFYRRCLCCSNNTLVKIIMSTVLDFKLCNYFVFVRRRRWHSRSLPVKHFVMLNDQKMWDVTTIIGLLSSYWEEKKTLNVYFRKFYSTIFLIYFFFKLQNNKKLIIESTFNKIFLLPKKRAVYKIYFYWPNFWLYSLH